MSKRDIQAVIQNALEREIPVSEIDLWLSVKTNLEQKIYKQGYKTKTTKLRAVWQTVYAAVVIVGLLVITFITPQGRAFAQVIFQFFTRTERRSFPVQVIETDTAIPATMLPTALISVAEAEAQIGFDIAEFPNVPEGFTYLGVSIHENTVSIEYEAQGGGGALLLMQSKRGFAQSEWDQVPADVIIPVEVGGLAAEYVQGAFVVSEGETSAKWNSDAPAYRLRWIKDSIWFELTRYGDVHSIEYLDMNALIALAESLK